MKPSLFLALLRWDIVRELRRKEIVLNMCFFGVLMLFLVQIGLGPLVRQFLTHQDPLWQGMGGAVGPMLFWICVLFAGTVGLSQSFAAEREGDSLVGLRLAPFDMGVFYLAKVCAVWIYVMLMEIILLASYVILFNFTAWEQLPSLLLILSLFTLGYIAPGVVLAAMTTTLRGGGEVVLRIMLFPLLMPLIYYTLRVKEGTFGVDAAVFAGADPFPFPQYLGILVAFDAIYLASGFLLFPKVLED